MSWRITPVAVRRIDWFEREHNSFFHSPKPGTRSGASRERERGREGEKRTRALSLGNTQSGLGHPLDLSHLVKEGDQPNWVVTCHFAWTLEVQPWSEKRLVIQSGIAFLIIVKT